MTYFSIDESIENIKNPYTKELFKEVYSSYAMVGCSDRSYS